MHAHVHLFKGALIQHRGYTVPRFKWKMIPAIRDNHEVFLKNAVIDDLASFGTFRPKILWDVFFLNGDGRVLWFSEECHDLTNLN